MRWLPRRLRYVPNLVRLVAFCTFSSAILLIFTLRAVAGNVHEGLLSFGREMMQYADPSASGAVRRLEINGVRMEFATGSTTDSVTRVLDYYEHRCAEHDGAVTEQLRDLAGHLPPEGRTVSAATGHAPSITTMRQGGDRQGYVACLDVGATRLSFDELGRRLRAFGANGNIAEVGRMRYLFAERAANGRTRFLGFWSDDDVNLRRMFPITGDAPGTDVPGVPRAPGLRRLLDAREIGVEYSFGIFAGATARNAVEQHYRAQMISAGWSLIPPRGPHPSVEGQTFLTYERGDATVSLVIGEGESPGQTSVTVFSAR